MELEQAKEKVVSYLSNQPAKLTLDYAVPFRGMWVFFFKAERRQRLAPLAVMERSNSSIRSTSTTRIRNSQRPTVSA